MGGGEYNSDPRTEWGPESRHSGRARSPAGLRGLRTEPPRARLPARAAPSPTEGLAPAPPHLLPPSEGVGRAPGVPWTRRSERTCRPAPARPMAASTRRELPRGRRDGSWDTREVGPWKPTADPKAALGPFILSPASLLYFLPTPASLPVCSKLVISSPLPLVLNPGQLASFLTLLPLQHPYPRQHRPSKAPPLERWRAPLSPHGWVRKGGR